MPSAHMPKRPFSEDIMAPTGKAARSGDQSGALRGSDAAIAAALASNGTGLNGGSSPELLELLHALQAMRTGDFTVRMRGDHVGIAGKIADTFNDIVSTNQRIATELERVGQVVGREGKT